MGIFVIIFNYCFLPLIGHPATQLPDMFWEMWGVVVAAYVGSRGTEKIMSIPGNSQVNLAGIVKVSQNSNAA
jgi:hypothetical protein